MLMLKIASLIVSVPLGIYVGCRLLGIGISWIKEALDSLSPKERKRKEKEEDIWSI